MSGITELSDKDIKTYCEDKWSHIILEHIASLENKDLVWTRN